MEVRNLRLCDLDFDRKQLKVVQGKGKRPLFATFGAFDSGIKKSISKRKNQKIISLECHEKEEGASTSLDRLRFQIFATGRSMGGKTGIKTAKILKEVSVHTLRHSFATHLLEDGMDILSIKKISWVTKIETIIYLQIAQLSTQKLFDPRCGFQNLGRNERF